MADSSFSLFKRSNNVWYAVYESDGKRHWKSTGCTDKRKAIQILRTLEFSPKPQKKISRSAIEFLADFLKFAQTSYRKKTVELYALVARRLTDLVGSSRLDQISPKTWDDYAMLRAGRVSEATLNMEQRALKAMMNRAVAWQYIQRSPFAGMKSVKVAEVPPKYFTRLEFEKLLSLVREGWLRDAILFAALTGIRRGELVNLRWSDVNTSERVIVIQSQGDFAVKGNKTRIVPLSSGAMAVLENRLKDPDCPYVFQHDGKKLWANWVTQLFRRYVRKAGLRDKGLHWHNLRSSFASWLVADGASIYAVSKLLGHSSVTLTQRYYARLSPETLHSTVDLIKVDIRKN